MLSNLAFVHVIDNQSNKPGYKLITNKGPFVSLLNKCHSYACIYAHMVSHDTA